MVTADAVTIFLCKKEGGFEPERVAALNKQSGGLFVASESLSGSESQLAFAAGKGVNPPLSARIKPVIERWQVYFFEKIEFEPCRSMYWRMGGYQPPADLFNDKKV